MNTWLRISFPLFLFIVAEIRSGCSFSCSPIFLATSLCGRNYRRESWRRSGQELFGGSNDYHSDALRRKGEENESLIEAGEFSRDRRFFLRGSTLSWLFWGSSMQPFRAGFFAANAAALVENEANGDGRLADAIVQSLVFEKILGSGSYKTVYLVSAKLLDTATGSTKTYRYAMAVERLRTKRDVKNAFRGITIPESIQQGVKDSEKDLFETTVDWWVQSSNVMDFVEGGQAFQSAALTTRSRSKPKKNFTGSRWLVSLKPVYESDFKRFIQNSPLLFPVGTIGKDETYWSEQVLLAFVLEILHAGKLMHNAGVVHRDIKPKNMMIYNVPSSSGSFVRRPVIIDYGFAELGDPLVLQNGRAGAKSSEKKIDICVERPGQLKGEVDYVIAEDLANYRGCQRGDTYAMGKTLYEFIFGSVELQEHQKDDEEAISVEGAEIRNQRFRDLLYNNPNAGTKSRFALSKDTAQCLMSIIKGLCGNPKDAANALSFEEAESILSLFLDSLGQSH